MLKNDNKKTIAKPFVKWAGGKSRLISDISAQLPSFTQEKPFHFVEPFVGSGAVSFWLLEHFENIASVTINDINADLINTYHVIKTQVHELIVQLNELQNPYLAATQEARKACFYEKRALFNARSESSVAQAALFIFLNRTCFNGLYRVNKKNEFNVPMGSYKSPKILDAENLLAVHKALQKVTIMYGDYQNTLNALPDDELDVLFYFDPPYKPISTTASFTSYAKGDFDDDEQIRLRDFCITLDNMGISWLLSNSDTKNICKNNTFFDDLYGNFSINRVSAARQISARTAGRGAVSELLIRSF